MSMLPRPHDRGREAGAVPRLCRRLRVRLRRFPVADLRATAVAGSAFVAQTARQLLCGDDTSALAPIATGSILEKPGLTTTRSHRGRRSAGARLQARLGRNRVEARRRAVPLRYAARREPRSI